ncbi:MAG: MFS transporter [Deltaproteobacteria bacterium]|nr:MFS transporter [Deltaproteobacteria bacterium]MBW2121505.1 MFS transporter [Deltaproteobacteria bacterium]
MSTRTKLFWVAVLYFAEGFPFGLVFDAFPVYLRFQGVSLASIGLLSLAGLPWTVKFLWAPAVDLVGNRRSWVVGCQAFLAFTLLLVLTMDPTEGSMILWLVMGVAVLSATQDIAIDAYTIELLDESEMGPANGLRVTTYRIALIAAGGLFVALAGWIGWKGAFATAALVLGLFAILSMHAPSGVNAGCTAAVPRAPGFALAGRILAPLRELYNRPGFLAVMIFILLFKLGDMSLGPMIRPFWVDRHFTPLQIGAVPGGLGVIFTIVGALLGGSLTSRWGIYQALWILGLTQAGSNLTYAAAAALPPSTALMYTASAVESFCGGLGTAPYLAFLMSICDKRYAATQYALLSALFGLTRALSGAVSGFATERFGYATYFVVTFLLAFPAYAFLPWVRVWARKRTPDRATAEA